MSKQRSLIDSALSDYYFAVAPISVNYERQHKTRFHFYFQKSQQIIQKYQSPVGQVQKNQTVKFPPPSQIQHFRILNEKSMDCQWSLYIFRLDIQGNNEQLVQVQKISLKDEWNAFISSKVAVYEKTIKFNSISCKLSYLVVISTNNQELLDSIQSQFGESKISVATNDQKTIEQEVYLEKNQVKKQDSNSQKIRAQTAIQQTEKTKYSSQQIKISKVIYRGRYSLQKEMNLIEQEQNMQLSNQQLEIAEQIELKVHQEQVSLDFQMILQPDEKESQSVSKNVRMVWTNSLYLNQKIEVIVPSYKLQKCIIVIILLTLLTLASGVWIFGNNGPKISQKQRNRRQKNPNRQKKQQVTKKNKSKK